MTARLARLGLGVLAAWAQTWAARADLPVHCLAGDVVGTWEFALGAGSGERQSCGHSRPDDAMQEPLVGGRHLWPAERLAVELAEGGDARVGGEPGSWTLVADEALEVRGGGREFLAFMAFEPLAADNGGEHLPLLLQRRHSRCNETVLGWYSRGRTSWGCWYGRRRAESGSFLQRRQRRGRASGQAAGLARFQTRPPALDWRNVSGRSWVDVPVQQGMCGGCYAVAAMHMLSARHRISVGDPSAEGFSVALPLFCSEYTQGCRGGYPFLATKWSEDVGLLPKSCAPFTEDGTCQARCGPAERGHRASNHRYVRGGEEAILLELSSAGPLAVSFASDHSLLQYTGGVWEPPPFRNVDGAEPGFIPPTHSALLVGYGEDPDGTGYWILQNAWGSDWGERGGFRISRDVARERGLESLVVAAEVVQEENPAVLEQLLGRRGATAAAVALISLASGSGDSSSGHRGQPLCRQAPSSPGEEPILVRLDAERNFRSLSFGHSAGTETAVQCRGQAPDSCRAVGPAAEVPDCSSLGGCECDLHGQELPYAGMRALAEKVLLMCTSVASPVRVLLIGLGGGAISSYLQDRCPTGRLLLESVESDERVAGLASRLFGFRPSPNSTVEVAEGLAALERRPAGSQDAVLVDCFAGEDRVPLGCRSQRFFAAARRVLGAEGLLLQNVWARSSASPAVAAEFEETLAAFAAAFGDPPRREVAFDAPESLELLLYGLRGKRWASLLPLEE